MRKQGEKHGHAGRHRGIETLDPQVLAYLLLEEVASQDVGVGLRHGGRRLQIVVTVVATGFDSDYFDEEPYSAPETDMKNEEPAVEAKDFALENKTNMWDSIKTESEPISEPVVDDDEMDVPPSLRERFKKKKK